MGGTTYYEESPSEQDAPRSEQDVEAYVALLYLRQKQLERDSKPQDKPAAGFFRRNLCKMGLHQLATSISFRATDYQSIDFSVREERCCHCNWNRITRL